MREWALHGSFQKKKKKGSTGTLFFPKEDQQFLREFLKQQDTSSSQIDTRSFQIMTEAF
jgi:hypothetical protein